MPDLRPLLLRYSEAAKIMRRNKARFVADYVKSGKVRVVYEGDRWMVPMSELERYISENLMVPDPAKSKDRRQLA